MGQGGQGGPHCGDITWAVRNYGAERSLEGNFMKGIGKLGFEG